jgi:hypothetical protein
MATAEDVGADGTPGRLSRSAIEPTLSLPLALTTWRDAHASIAVDAFVEEVRRIAAEWDGTADGPPAPVPVPAAAPPPRKVARRVRKVAARK